MEKIVCRVLTGPTGSGKSRAAMRIAAKYGLEIVCMDSMQVYRGMDVGTDKPSADDRARVPHHLIDIIEPEERFSVALWRERAEKLTREKKGRLLFVGGTGLYLRAMRQGWEMGCAGADDEIRRELNGIAEEEGGKERLHAMLSRIDSAAAERLDARDVRRVIRAIEVWRTTGKPLSAQEKDEPEYEWRIVSTFLPREALYRRINERVTRMIRDGLFSEVENLIRDGIGEDAVSMQGIGYKESVKYLKGEWDREKTVDEIRKASRHLAKRQETFLKREDGVRYVNMLDPDCERQMEEVLMDGAQFD